MTSSAPGIELKTLEGGVTSVPEEALAGLAAGHRGPVLRPGDPDFEECRKIWNDMIDRRPGLIARATSAADVVHAVRFARDRSLLVSVRGGGHNIAGLAVCEGGLMIDLSLMKGVTVDAEARLARAEAGCLLSDVDRATQAHGLAAVLGFVSTTGIAGLTVGGGFGYLTRRHGWTCDTLKSVEIVTAEGDVVSASEDENAELFWCVRGGGGNFGVVVSFEYRLFSVGPEIFGGPIAWRAEDAPDVLQAYAETTGAAPRELTCVAVLRIAPPAPWLPPDVHGQPIVMVVVCYTGDPADGARLVEKLRRTGKPVADIATGRPYVQMQSLLDATQPKGRRYYWKSEYVSEVGPSFTKTLIEQSERVPSAHSAILVFHVGGALNELPADHSPAGNRTAAFVVNVAGSWEHAVDDAANIAWAREAWTGIRPFSTGGVYLNFLTEDEGADRVEAAYGQKTLETLARLKAKYDPMNLFRHNKPLAPPEARATTEAP